MNKDAIAYLRDNEKSINEFIESRLIQKIIESFEYEIDDAICANIAYPFNDDRDDDEIDNAANQIRDAISRRIINQYFNQ